LGGVVLQYQEISGTYSKMAVSCGQLGPFFDDAAHEEDLTD